MRQRDHTLPRLTPVKFVPRIGAGRMGELGSTDLSFVYRLRVVHPYLPLLPFFIYQSTRREVLQQHIRRRPTATPLTGIDFSMDGNVFMTYAYPWPSYTTNNKQLDDATYEDSARWNRMQREWYVKGRAYRDLAAIDGTPNPIFARWLAHPSYNR